MMMMMMMMITRDMNKTAGRLQDDVQRLKVDKKELGRQRELPAEPLN